MWDHKELYDKTSSYLLRENKVKDGDHACTMQWHRKRSEVIVCVIRLRHNIHPFIKICCVEEQEKLAQIEVGCGGGAPESVALRGKWWSVPWQKEASETQPKEERGTEEGVTRLQNETCPTQNKETGVTLSRTAQW